MPMKAYTVFEYDQVPLVPTSTEGIVFTPRELAALSRIEKYLPQGAFLWGHNFLSFSHFCGVIQVGDKVIEILPKLFRGSVSNGKDERAILVAMLETCRRLTYSSNLQGSTRLQQHYLLDVFIIHFCDILTRALADGLWREYIPLSNNEAFIRGKLLVMPTVNLNRLRLDRVYCEFDELQEDNLLNRIIKRTLKLLLGLARSNSVKRQISQLLMFFVDVGEWSLNFDDLCKMHFDRVNRRFEPVWEQCCWFLRGLNPDVVAGEVKCIALLFDMNKLFEEYVAMQLRHALAGSPIKVHIQHPLQYLCQTGEQIKEIKLHFRMQPDLTLFDSNGIRMILDTKWKMLDPNDPRFGISQSDLYQVYTYGGEYCSTDVVLVYPSYSSLQNLPCEPYTYCNAGRRVWIATVDLSVIKKGNSEIRQAIGETVNRILCCSKDTSNTLMTY
jgi:5-methylcytosine-specific restriction enzyme subunit McrC